MPNWTLLADPEGGELCAFVREPAKLPAYRLYEVVVDAEDHQAISRWWADRFGVEAMHDREGGFSWIERAPGMPWELVFQAVPEPKTVKNRIHWDLRGVTEEFVAAGAHLQRRHDHEIGWDVLTDPGRQRVLRVRAANRAIGFAPSVLNRRLPQRIRWGRRQLAAVGAATPWHGDVDKIIG